MTTYTTRPHDTPPVENEPRPASERTSPVLLGALAVALVALGAWWFAQRDGGGAIDMGLPVATETVPVPAAAPTVRETRDADRTAGAGRTERDQRDQRADPAVANRDARPLAGNPMPEYPRAALRNGQEGSVLLSIAVDARGVPTDVQVVRRSGSHDRDFDRAAITAARQWRFEPAMRGGKPVPSTVQLPVDFRRG
jgi:protein TonB